MTIAPASIAAPTTAAVEITPAEQLDYLVASSRLMLWFAWTWAGSHPQEPMTAIIRKRTDIFRRTDLNPDWLDHCGTVPDAWLDILDRLGQLHAEMRGDPDAARFEEAGIALLQPRFAARVERDVADQRGATAKSGYQCGSLRHDPVPDAKNPARIHIHIANACYPGSPFDDPLYMPACLLVLLAQCQARFGISEVGCGSWMNSLPRWIALFPQEWQGNMGPPNEDVCWHYGFWGQFITARRTFNHRLGAEFRRTGRMPYALRYSWCPVDALRRHLEDLLRRR